MTEYNVAYGYWEQSIFRANQCFDRSQTVLALFFYHQAIERSEVLVEANPTSRQSIGAMLVSYHNLAELYERNGAFKPAWSLYQKAQSRTHALLQQFGNVPSLLWGSRVAYTQLCLFEKQHSNTCAGKPSMSKKLTLLAFQEHAQTSLH